MAFIQPCFIRKNSPELRKKLEELGYEPNAYESFWEDDNRYIITTIGSQGYGYYTLCIKNCCLLENELFIDCETNEELFLALAALRYDTDINQIYLWNERHLVKCIRDYSCTLNIEATPYYMCQLIDNSDIKFEIPCKELRKATVEEIVEHFK